MTVVSHYMCIISRLLYITHKHISGLCIILLSTAVYNLYVYLSVWSIIGYILNVQHNLTDYLKFLSVYNKSSVINQLLSITYNSKSQHTVTAFPTWSLDAVVLVTPLSTHFSRPLLPAAAHRFRLKMSIGYQVFGVPIPNRYQLVIWYFSPNVFGILLVLSILSNV